MQSKSLVMILACGLCSSANGASLEQRIAQLERLVSEQQRLIHEQQAMLAPRDHQQPEHGKRGAVGRSGAVHWLSGPQSSHWRARGTGPGVANAPAVATVGKAPPQERTTPKLETLPDIGGVLTPKGAFVVEPALQFSNSAVNRFSFVGVEILSTFLIGLVEAQNTDRNLYSVSLTGRYGLTDRTELELKLPYIHREERIEATIPQAQGPEGQANTRLTRNLKGSGLGDVEAALHYQLNRGGKTRPFLVGNLRYKSNTGTGPFDTPRNADGLNTELATGSGFHSVEPSLTVLAPMDPALFFANLGYLHNFKSNVNEVVVAAQGGNQPGQIVGEVNPGNAVRTSFGLGQSLNQRTSFTLGYKHDFIRRTRTEINAQNFYSPSLSIGSLLLGYSFRPFQTGSVNVNLEIGVTGDAPDIVMTLRSPRRIN